MKTFTTTLFFLFSFSILYAQDITLPPEQPEPTINWELNFITGVPISSFQDAMQDVGFGLDALLFIRMPNKSIGFGIQYSPLFYSSERIDVFDNIAGFNKRYRLRTLTGSNLLHGMVRFQPKLKSFMRPYADAYFGAHHLYTTTSLIDPEASEDSTVGRTRQNSEWRISYGAALGASINLARDFGLALNLKCAWYWSPTADFYVKKDNFSIINSPFEAYEQKHSPIQLIIPTIGFTLEIRDCYGEDEPNN